ncbi:CHAT domain-containing protein [Paenarthrobacter sp. FR1]|uniref:CHAT domain-containing protein n=1 Tax=Paenarthrobacter sp. FR1 TaxID=3439548 RepID=UPI003DA270D1
MGLSHVYGIADSDTAVQDYLPEQVVVTLISKHWRVGHFPAELAPSLENLWACLYRLGLDTETVRAEVAKALLNSQLGRRMQGEALHRLDPDSVDRNVLTYLEKNPLTPSNLASLGSFALDAPSSHLPIVHALLMDQELEAAHLVTMLELTACLPDNAQMAWNTVALTTASRQILMYSSMPGGWPGPGQDDVPDWVRDCVTVTGARMTYASAGFVPGWLFVAESQDELNAVRRWAYNTQGSFFAGLNDSGDLVIGFEMTLPSDGETVQTSWLYPLDDALSLSRVKTMAAMGLIRIDIYRISSNAELEYVYSYGCSLPRVLVDALYNHLAAHELPHERVRTISPLSAPQRLLMMAQIEQHAFDGLHDNLSADVNSRLGIAFKRYLEIVDASTAAAFNGHPVDTQAYETAREVLRQTIGSSRERFTEPIDLKELGEDRAYAQFRFAKDSPRRLVADIAYLDESGATVVDSHELAGAYSAAWSIERQSAALADGFHDIASLLELGISKMVVNPHSVIYNLPYHEALLRLGFDQVSYCHRAGTLTRRRSTESTGSVVHGYAGEGKRHIRAVDIELQFIGELYESAHNEVFPTRLPAVAHFAGHGHSGTRNYEVGIEIDAQEPPLSSARVLMEFDAVDTDLVYLSACSTGRGSYGTLQLAETVPLDVAFIEKGARSVLSTAAPVNDAVACFFACVFHHLRRSGDDIWKAYVLAREATRDQRTPYDRSGLDEMLDRIWPNWRTDLAQGSATYPDDWQLFRLSGRHWD